MIYLSDEVNMDDEFDYLGETYFNPLKESVYNTWWNNTYIYPIMKLVRL